MLTVNRSKSAITGVLNGKPFNIPFEETKYKALQKIHEKLSNTKNSKDFEFLLKKAESFLVIDYTKLISDKNEYLMFNPATQEYFLVLNKGKKDESIADIPFPQVLVDHIQVSFDNDIDFMPIIKAWKNFLFSRIEFKTKKDDEGNSIITGYNILPYDKFLEKTRLFANYLDSKFVDQDEVDILMEKGLTEEAAINRATYQDLAITEEGIIAGYKVVIEVLKKFILTYDENGKVLGKKEVDRFESNSEIDEVSGKITTIKGKPKYQEERWFKPAIYTNGEDFYCDGKLGQLYKVGSMQYLPRTATVNRNNTFGGGGLYGGGLSYIEGYQSDNTKTLITFMNPADIISFQDDGKAIRFWRMFPNGVKETSDVKLEGIYHSSKYLEDTTKKLEEEIALAVKISKKEVEETKLKIDNFTRLLNIKL